MLKLDYKKIEEYSEMFQKMKQECFPSQEYQYKIEACSAFAHILSEKAREQGLQPQKIWCYKSKISPDLLEEMQQKSGRDFSPDETSSLIVSRIPNKEGDGIDYLIWQEHHVAMCLDLPIYQDSPKCERIVFDPVLFEAPVREKDWISALNTDSMYTEIRAAEENDKTNQLDLRAKIMLKNVKKENPIQLLKSPLVVLANVEKRKNNSPSLSVNKDNLK